ncbi:MAG: cysteine hydrolase family protein [Bacillota bacterium]|nr:cysteine hydrolase family protein [Bacillota bacterium]
MKRALLVIDVQNEYFTGKLPITYPNGSFNNILKIMDIAKQNDILIIVIQHTALQSNAVTFRKGSKEWEMHDEISKRKYDYLIEKNLPGSFTGTNLEEILKKNEIDTIVISGYMTQMCCDTTSRQAFHLGYSVEFLSDATGTLNVSNYAGTVTAEELHRSILATQAMRFSKVITSSEWIQIIEN